MPVVIVSGAWSVGFRAGRDEREPQDIKPRLSGVDREYCAEGRKPHCPNACLYRRERVGQRSVPPGRCRDAARAPERFDGRKAGVRGSLAARATPSGRAEGDIQRGAEGFQVARACIHAHA